MIRVLDLFSGIGGFALAGQMVRGFDVQQFVEINPYCQGILKKNFPGTPIHDDIRTYSAQIGDFDCITGGFPCQDISCANPNGRGLEGERSGLFFELIRLICECRPHYVVLENVKALLTGRGGRDMGAVLWELSECGYDAEWQVVSAASVGAPHLRERVFIVAYRNSQRRDNGRNHWKERYLHSNCHGKDEATPEEWSKLQPESWAMGSDDAYFNGIRLQVSNDIGCCAEENSSRTIAPIGRACRADNPWTTEPSVLRVAARVPNRMERIRGLGNAVVPQCAAVALRRVLELDRDRRCGR